MAFAPHVGDCLQFLICGSNSVEVLASFVLDTSKPDVSLALGGRPGWELSFIAISPTYWHAQAKKGRPPAVNSNSNSNSFFKFSPGPGVATGVKRVVT